MMMRMDGDYNESVRVFHMFFSPEREHVIVWAPALARGNEYWQTGMERWMVAGPGSHTPASPGQERTFISRINFSVEDGHCSENLGRWVIGGTRVSVVYIP